MIKFYFLLLPVICCSCFTTQNVDYLGSSFTPTQHVDVYVDPSAIKKPYTIVGKSYVSIIGLTTLEQVQKAAVEKAKQKGADAILFRDYITLDGSTIQTVTKSDSIGIPVRIRTTTASPNETTRLDILFLKYD